MENIFVHWSRLLCRYLLNVSYNNETDVDDTRESLEFFCMYLSSTSRRIQESATLSL